jgi:phenylpropionate dioxygenase-like ring-hydroxylating dioxygenase large terminal subunit
MFLAHKSSIKEGCYIPLEQYNNTKILANIDGEYKLISNVCPHQKSLISIRKGSGNRVCPYHNWSFDINGNPLTSGRTECKNNNPLLSEPVYEWDSLLFSVPVASMPQLHLENFQFVEHRVDIVNANSITIMDLFLDVDHIPTVHRGVYEQLGIDATEVLWNYYDNGSEQTVKQGAKWIAIYPNTMIEWQLGALFITVTEQINQYQSKVYVFKYREPNMHEKVWEMNQHVWETAWTQDKYQAELIVGINKDNLETPKQHYRDWLNGSYI